MDGDIIHVSLVETNYNQVLTLPFSAATLEIPLKVGRNRLRIRAVNTGTSGPNTMGMYFRPTSQVISGLTSTQMGLQQNQEIEFVLILEDENEEYEERVPTKLIVRNYNFWITVRDNGQLVDDDLIALTLRSNVGPNAGNLQDEDILLRQSDQLSTVRRLKSHINTLSIGAKSVGDVTPATLSFEIYGVEQSPNSPNYRTMRFDGSVALTIEDLANVQIECRRQRPTGNKPEEILSKNLEAVFRDPYGYYGSRMPCGSTAHHIVAKGANPRFPAVAQSQAILAKYQIDINDASNGVVLRQNSLAPIGGANHRTLHTRTYHNAVLKKLMEVDITGSSKTDIQQALHEIRLALLSNTFPY